MSIYTHKLTKLSESELARECRSAYTCWLDLPRQERNGSVRHRADFCLAECERRGLPNDPDWGVREIWKPAVEAVKKELAERRRA